MRILIRTSKWAIWARRIGSLALPLAIIPVFLHRERLILSSDFAIIETVALIVAGLAMFLALGAFVRLWITGDQGWGKATAGFLLGLLCLAPFGAVAYFAARYPSTADISTDPDKPPGIVSQLPAHQPVDYEAVAAVFPNAQDRNYPIGAPQMFAIVAGLVDERGWEPRARREPQTPLAEGQVNAVAMTLLGWREEVAIRISGVPQGSVVAMRSAALHPGHDLGENGRRIEEFLVALDERVTLLLRDAPVTAAPAEEEETAPQPASEAEAE